MPIMHVGMHTLELKGRRQAFFLWILFQAVSRSSDDSTRPRSAAPNVRHCGSFVFGLTWFARELRKWGDLYDFSYKSAYSRSAHRDRQLCKARHP